MWEALLPKCWVWLETSIYTYTSYLGLYINFLHIHHTMLIDPLIHAHQLKNFNRRKWETIQMSSPNEPSIDDALMKIVIS